MRSWYDHKYPLSLEVTIPSRDGTPVLLSDSKDIAPQPVIGRINLTPLYKLHLYTAATDSR